MNDHYWKRASEIFKRHGIPAATMKPATKTLTEHIIDAYDMVEATEREACAKIADESAAADRENKRIEKDPHMRDIIQDCVITADAIAIAIRARGR